MLAHSGRGVLFTVILPVLLCTVGSAAAQRSGVWWERKPPSIEEISGGKLAVGDKITKENVDLVKEYMAEAFYLDTKNGAEWEIVQTTPGERLVIPAMVEATNQNLGKALIREDGTVLMQSGEPWAGGFPVPEPQSGLQVMVNRQFIQPDGVMDYFKSYWVNPEGNTYKNTIGNAGTLATTARVYEEPKPVLPGFENELSRQLLVFHDPYDVRGISVLSIIYVDQSKLPDAWGYVPVLRRVQRFSSGQRYDSSDGSDLRAGDLNTFSDPLGLWEFKLVDRKFMFSPLTGAEEQAGAVPVDQNVPLINGRYPRDARVELRDTYVIEAVPKDPSHIYSRKLLFADSATWWTWLGQFYDRQERLWMAFSLWFRRLSNDSGNWPALTWVSIQNYQTRSATLFDIAWYWANPVDRGIYNPEMFSLKYIAAQGR